MKMINRYGKTYPARRIKREPLSTYEGQCSYSMIKVEKDSRDDAAAVSTHGVYIKHEELKCNDTDVTVKDEIEIGPTAIQPQYIGSSLHTTDALTVELIQCGGADVALGTTTPGAASYHAHSTGRRSVVHGGTSDQIEMKDKGILQGNKQSTSVIFFCDNCQFKCAFKSRIVNHMRIHTGEKPYSCNICKYKCSVKSVLMKHKRIHTGEKPFSCNICDYRCVFNSGLVAHMRIHTGEKPYLCKFCEYKSVDKTSMVRHMRTHTGEKPYSCNICEYKCVVKSSLVKHMRTHTGEKPYSCNICQYKCATKSSLVRHMRRHSNTPEKPFSCNVTI